MKIDNEVDHVPGTYMITDKNNEKAYFGSTEDLRRRGLRHSRDLKNCKHDNVNLQEHYHKHQGELEFIGLPMESKEASTNLEQELLDTFKGSEVLCNIAIDARSTWKGLTRPSEVIAKVIEYNTGKPKSEAHRKAISNTLTGRKLSPKHAAKAAIAALGRVNTEEHNRRISEAQKGKVVSDETKRKLSEAHKGKILSEAHRQKLSEVRMGVKRSAESVEKTRQGLRKPVEVNGICYKGINVAAEELGMTVKVISNRLDSDRYPDFKRLKKD